MKFYVINENVVSLFGINCEVLNVPDDISIFIFFAFCSFIHYSFALNFEQQFPRLHLYNPFFTLHSSAVHLQQPLISFPPHFWPVAFATLALPLPLPLSFSADLEILRALSSIFIYYYNIV